MGNMSDLNALNLEPGEVVGGYTLIDRLGSGAMGSVWRVRDDGGQTYAMKILRDSLADDSSAGNGSSNASAAGNTALRDPNLKEDVTPRERLRREAMALKKVNHPGVCGIVDMELDDSLAFIVTELIEGKNLKDDVAINGRYIGDDLERLARKLIEATKAVHAAGIIHRDIKPTNVMVSATGPVLVDFGIAMGEGESHVTRTGLVMGTPGFIAPEIIDGAEADDMTDWWSVASVLAFAATGAPVFGTKPMMAVLERAAAGNANLTGLPAGTLAAFRSALNPDRSQRCTPDELLHAIALDALNPMAWQGAPAGPFGAGAIAGAPTAIVAAPTEATEVMPPFGADAEGNGTSTAGMATGAAEPDESNPRTLWRAADAIRTRTLQAEDAPTVASSINTDAATAVFPHVDDPIQPTRVMPDNASATAPERTTMLPAEPTTPLTPPVPPEPPAPSFPPAVPSFLSPVPYTAPDAQVTTVQPPINPAVRPAVQRMIDQTAQAAPTEALVQNPAAPNPADVRRGAYLQRGTLPLALLAIPLALLAASFPLLAIAAAAILLWLVLTLAYNTESQLEREGRRGGERKGSDTLIRAASLPWHMVKGLLLSLPRLVLLIIIDIAGTAAAAIALSLPIEAPIIWNFTADWTVPVPLLIDVPYSPSGLTLGGFMAVGWLVTVFGPQAMMMRLGAGALRGLAPRQPGIATGLGAFGQSTQPVAAPVRGRRGTVMFTIWLIVTLALAAVPLTGISISWIPLV
ncbi:serine/threonine-protein kinase [Bifidobacterium felsineum]|uniref:serine/threonine-protein kinase n=1 Tax=Bifidobacterium felsineum TaxID=2045440 RepID=UPI001BDD8AB2|nr:serine/threonine-protein kinase [Bifidobacterium felsineum]MBT1163021.1 protein kinase [Bifidobacterium felsineum]